MGAFDDLIPNRQQAAPSAMAPVPAESRFADLIPQAPKPPQPSMLESVGRGAVQGATLSFGDEIAGVAANAERNYGPWLNGPIPLIASGLEVLASKFMPDRAGTAALESYQQGRDANREANQAAQEANPGSYLAGNVAGGVAATVPMVAAAPAAFGAGGAGLLTRSMASGATAAGLGAVESVGRQNEVDPLQVAKDAGVSGVVGAAAPAFGRMVGKGAEFVASKVAPAAQAPTREALKEAATAAYQRADDAGVIIGPDAMRRLASNVQTALVEKGYHPAINPEVKVIVDELGRLAEGNVTLKGVDVLRQIAGGARGATNQKTKALGGEVVTAIDDFLNTLNPGDFIAGRSKEGVQALQEARRLWQTQAKTKVIEDALERAANNAGAAGSGGNMDNAIRQQFRSILNSKKQSAGFTNEEKAAMSYIVRGGRGEGLLRAVSKLSPEGNGMMLMFHLLGGAATSGATLPIAAAGMGAKAITNRLTPARVDSLEQLVRSGGVQAPVSPAAAPARAVLDDLARRTLVGGAPAIGQQLPQ